jgi:hypothetical protein
MNMRQMWTVSDSGTSTWEGSQPLEKSYFGAAINFKINTK